MKIGDSIVSYELLTLQASSKDVAIITCTVADYKVEFLIDSGASVNTIAENVFNTMIRDKKTELRMMEITASPKTKLTAYTSFLPLTVIASFSANLWIGEDRKQGIAKFFVIRNIEFDVLRLGLNILVPDGCQDAIDDLDRISLQLHNIDFNKDSENFPKFNMRPVTLNVIANSTPRRYTYTNIAPAWRDPTRERLQKMVDTDIIEEVTENMEFSHCSSMLAVPKGKKDFRLVVDLRNPNRCILREPHRMPTFEEIMSKLAGCVKFSTIDLSNAFFHVELDENSRHLTNFFSGEKYYRYKRLPFGLANAPDIFQSAMERLLQGCEGYMVYLDDILVYGKSSAEHRRNYAEVQRRLSRNNVRLNLDKCYFDQDEVLFLGFTINKHGYRITEDRLTAIKNFRTPRNVAEVRSFIGLMNFVDRFIINRADKTQHLQEMIRDGNFSWSREAEDEFNFMRTSALSSIRTLKFFNPNDRTELVVDASPIGLGAVLVQYDNKEKSRIISCASKKLSGSEKNYPQTQLESLAVVWGAERFQFYLTGRHFTILTDAEANEFIFNEDHRIGKRAITRAESWALRLQRFDFTMKRVSSEENIADVFSRLIKESQVDDPFDEAPDDHVLFIGEYGELPLTRAEITTETAKDELLSKVA